MYVIEIYNFVSECQPSANGCRWTQESTAGMDINRGPEAQSP